jgi:2-oxoglutarate ferredoxin oxidoreductase subunit beta
MANVFDLENIEISWCPGCGDFPILESLKRALAELELTPDRVVFGSGIGQAAKLPHYIKGHFFNGLHGRALSNATAIKAANPSLKVIAIGGDGDMYGEGGNHFLHTIRRNPDITNFVHNNMVYGLTKGQASPTSQVGFKTPVQVEGVFSTPVNPVALALVQGASFVARAFAGAIDRTKEIMKEALSFKGYALVDILQPCVSFNKVNTYAWFKERVYYLDGDHDEADRMKALERALEPDRFALGVLFRRERPSFETSLPPYDGDDRALYARSVDLGKLDRLIQSL